MSNTNGATIESVRKAPVKGADVKGFFKAPDEDDEKILKWRFLAKGPALDAILAVLGARAVPGEKQVSFLVEEAGDLELGEVVRHFFIRAQAAGVTLADLITLIEKREASGDNK
jgi:hypothetical protein